MKSKPTAILGMVLLISLLVAWSGNTAQQESPAERDARMGWWREARFGLFIHWGLYSVPAGEWKGKTNHAEWIRTTAQIPLEEYDKFATQFNPEQFNAEEWVRAAKEAGMKYIVITSKHHDGFCLFDSKFTNFDVTATPFRRDILKELAEAARKHGIKLCFYHSIMDWHHADYLPRREWEKDRSAQGAEFDRYVAYMKNQLRELLTNYGDVGVLWFDGEWENRWDSKLGLDLYNYVRSLQPNIIINNRVGAARAGMQGLGKEGEFAGDFGTPEQQIPATGLPGVDWETCMTMNDHWGYNKNDQKWKSTETLIRMLADIASKGGNFLLNVGPTAEGIFPQASIERLREIGQWMKVNGEAIYGTQASPFQHLDWGRSTQRAMGGDKRLYLHIFDWPANGQLRVHGIANLAKQVYLLSDAEKRPLEIAREEDALVIRVPTIAPDARDSVVVLDVAGKPEVHEPPNISAAHDIFLSALSVQLTTTEGNEDIRYALDGTVPSISSAIAKGIVRLTETAVVSARSFRDGKPVSDTSRRTFTKVRPRPAVSAGKFSSGVGYAYFEGEWERLPDFALLKSVKTGVLPDFLLSPKNRPENCGMEFTGYIRIPEVGVYTFFVESDDGSRMYVGDELVVENDFLHGMQEEKGEIALAAGLHSIRVAFFQKSGGAGLSVSFQGPRGDKRLIPAASLFHKE